MDIAPHRYFGNTSSSHCRLLHGSKVAAQCSAANPRGGYAVRNQIRGKGKRAQTLFHFAPQPNFSVKPTPTSSACGFPSCYALRCGLPVALGLFKMKLIAASVLFACTCHVAYGFDLAHHHNALMHDEDPRALIVQFVDADAQGLQTSSEYWPLVKRFTDWPDSPGWDFAFVAKSYKVGRVAISGNSATVPVTYKLVGTRTSASSPMCPTGVCKALERAMAKQTIITYHLKKVDARWVVEGPQNGPIVNVRFAYNQAMQNNGTCLRGDCSIDPVVRTLRNRLQ